MLKERILHHLVVQLSRGGALLFVMGMAASSTYEENLAAHRLVFHKITKKVQKSVELSTLLPLDKTSDLEGLLLKRKVAYQAINTLKGYTVQVYMGNSKTRALQIQEKVSPFIAPHLPKFQYREPNYTIRFGFFSDKLEAYFIYLTLIKRFPTVIICPSVIPKAAYEAQTSSTTAIAATLTCLAPCSNSTFAQEAKVAPVVRISSTRSRCLSKIRLG